MDFNTGKELMTHIDAASAAFANLSHAVEKLTEPERSQLKLGLSKTMGEMYLELIYPIGLQHPALDPVNSHKMDSKKD